MTDLNVGRSFDRIAERIRPGPAKEYVARLPRRMCLADARAAALALVTLLENGGGR